jgi:hypothetical protein
MVPASVAFGLMKIKIRPHLEHVENLHFSQSKVLLELHMFV